MKTKISKKDAILATSLKLFAEHGFAHVSIAMIADQADVTKSLIFHHFGNKEQLWDEVKQHYFSQYAKTQQVLFIEEKNPLELVEKSVRNYFNYISENPLVAKFFTYAHLAGDESCGVMDKPLIAQATLLIRQAQEQGLVRKGLNPVILIMNFITAINQYFVARCRYQQWDPELYEDNNDFIDQLLHLLMSGIKP